MANERFRVAKGKMLVISPENDSEWREVVVVYDKSNDAFGVMLIGDSQLKGYTFFVPQQVFKKTRDEGTPANKLKQVT